jgi:hypothetical protein
VNLFSLASAQTTAQVRAEQASAGVSEGSLPPETDYQGALDAMYKSKEDAMTADKALFDAINRELSWAPQAIPVRRGFWAFRRS